MGGMEIGKTIGVNTWAAFAGSDIAPWSMATSR